MRAILASPWHRRHSHDTLVLEVTGRRSGRRYRLAGVLCRGRRRPAGLRRRGRRQAVVAQPARRGAGAGAAPRPLAGRAGRGGLGGRPARPWPRPWPASPPPGPASSTWACRRRSATRPRNCCRWPTAAPWSPSTRITAGSSAIAGPATATCGVAAGFGLRGIRREHCRLAVLPDERAGVEAVHPPQAGHQPAEGHGDGDGPDPAHEHRRDCAPPGGGDPRLELAELVDAPMKTAVTALTRPRSRPG